MHRHSRTFVSSSVLAQALVLAVVIAGPSDAADDGQLAFNNNCRTCHSIKEGDNRLGPSLHKIFGAKAGAAKGYTLYSDGLKGSGITWDEAMLDRFIANPDAVIPNNNMNPYTGMTDAAVRAKIIAYLKSQGG